MKGSWRTFLIEIIWILLILSMAIATVQQGLYGTGEDCYNSETYPPCDDNGCGCRDEY